MNERTIFAAILLLIGAGSGYLTLALWRAEESGKWLFLIVTAFFLTIGARLLLPPPQRGEEPPTRFVSHRFMTLIMVVIILGVVAAVVTAVLKR